MKSSLLPAGPATSIHGHSLNSQTRLLAGGTGLATLAYGLLGEIYYQSERPYWHPEGACIRSPNDSTWLMLSLAAAICVLLAVTAARGSGAGRWKVNVVAASTAAAAAGLFLAWAYVRLRLWIASDCVPEGGMCLECGRPWYHAWITFLLPIVVAGILAIPIGGLARWGSSAEEASS